MGIGRAQLKLLHTAAGVGYENRKAEELQLYFSFGALTVSCSEQDMQPYRNAWELLPVLRSATGKPAGVDPSAPPAGSVR